MTMPKLLESFAMARTWRPTIRACRNPVRGRYGLCVERGYPLKVRCPACVGAKLAVKAIAKELDAARELVLLARDSARHRISQENRALAHVDSAQQIESYFEGRPRVVRCYTALYRFIAQGRPAWHL